MTTELGLFVAAGFVGGIINVVAGGAKLFVFPMLLASGLPPIVANATGTVALWPAQAPALWVYRAELLENRGELARRALPALAGSLGGAFALIFSSEQAFTNVIPFLLVVSVVAIVLGPRAGELLRRAIRPARLAAVTGVLLFGIGFYGAYFGAGMGFLLLAVFGAIGGIDLQRANARKLLFAFAINTTAVLPLALSGLVDWLAAAGVLAGGLAGGYVGARVARRLPEKPLRWTVAVLGVVLTASFLLR